MSLVQEPHASKWQESVEFTLDVIKIYCKDFGEYIWPKIIVADADDGMEYPMLTLDGGTYPQHQYLLAHEVGHMWFYGMVGSNETYRASLDEGFTQFLTIWSMDKITGKKRFSKSPYKFLQKYKDSTTNRYDRLYAPYLNDVWSGYDHNLNTHASDFNGAIRQGGSYRLVYHKTGTMLYNLKYVLGDSLFMNAMKHYVKSWTGKHPYDEDFRKSIIEYTKADLNWFFDQWMETTKFVDYEIFKLNKLKSSDDSTQYEIIFKRKGQMQMPIDFTITNDKGLKTKYHIPNTWFVKATDAQILPKWYGWGLLQQTYSTKISVEGKLKNIEIDPEHYLADIDLTNNTLKNNEQWKFDSRTLNAPSWEKKRNFWRPDLWWNRFDGFQLGLSTNGEYFNQQYEHDASIWWNTGFIQNKIPSKSKNNHQYIAFNLNYKYNLSQYWRQLFFKGGVQYNAGLTKLIIGFEKTFRFQDLKNPRYTKIFINHSILHRNSKTDSLYLLYPGYWSVSKLNSFLSLGIQRNYPLGKKSFGDWILEVRIPGIASDFNYSYIQFTSTNLLNIKKFEFRTKIFSRIGTGNTPLESALYLAGIAPEGLYNNRITRAAGFIPENWVGYSKTTNHFQMGGGLNLRGYAGFSANSVENFNHVGRSGGAISIELDFDKLFPLKATQYTKFFHFDTYLFHDMGILNNSLSKTFSMKSNPLRMSSGIGTALTIKLDNLNIKPFILRFDLPLLLNTPPENQANFQLRYVVGLNRSF